MFLGYNSDYNDKLKGNKLTIIIRLNVPLISYWILLSVCKSGFSIPTKWLVIPAKELANCSMELLVR